MNVLIACEFSGVVRDAFRARGHEAWSCDLLGPDELPDEFEAQRWPNYHHVGDVREILPAYGPWDLLLAFPPCTYLCNSGVRWLYRSKFGVLCERDEARWAEMRAGAELFRWLLEAPVRRIAVENPVMHGYARDLVGRGPDQTIQPWQFGHGETKATCLWLKGLAQLSPTDVVDGRHARIHLASPGPQRWMERSRTLKGVAQAMAVQWGQE